MILSQWQRYWSSFHDFIEYKNCTHLQASLWPWSPITIVLLLHKKLLEDLLIIDFSLFYLFRLCGLSCLLYIAFLLYFLCICLCVSPCLLWVISRFFLCITSCISSVAMAINSHKHQRNKSPSVLDTPSKSRGTTLPLVVTSPKRKSVINAIYWLIARSSSPVISDSRL